MLPLLLLGCTLLDRAPPTLSARVVPGPHPHQVTVEVEAADPSGWVGWVEAGDVRAEVVDGEARVAAADLPDGPVTLQVVVEDQSPWGHRSTQSLTTLVDHTPPSISLREAREGVGRTVALWVDTDEPLVGPRLTVFDTERPLYAVGDRYRAMVGIGLRTEPGEHPVVVQARDAAGNEAGVDGVLVVTEVDYPVKGSIRLTRAQRAARKDEAAKAQMRAERDGAYALERHDQRWSGPFARPLVGRQTSPFGAYRRYSDGDRSYHTGVDLTNRRGTPVTAAAAGEVVVAKLQAIHGNAVILHHGQGVTSSYSHLREIDVAVGDTVEAGDQLGIMGNTGQSTGPHLHFGMVVSGRAVDPTQWLEGDPSAPPAPSP